MELYQTIYGKRLFEHEIPEINRNLNKIAVQLDLIAKNLSKLVLDINKQEQEKSTTITSLVLNNIELLKSIKISDVFSKRITNSLENSRYRMFNLYDLVTSKMNDLNRVRNFGPKCFYEISEFFKLHNLDYEMDDNEILNTKINL